MTEDVQTERTAEETAQTGPDAIRLTARVEPRVAEQYRRAAAHAGKSLPVVLGECLGKYMRQLIEKRKGQEYPPTPDVLGRIVLSPDDFAAKLAEQSDFMRQRELAIAIGVGESTLKAWRKAGCPHYQQNGRGAVWFSREDVIGWFRKQQAATAQ